MEQFRLRNLRLFTCFLSWLVKISSKTANLKQIHLFLFFYSPTESIAWRHTGRDPEPLQHADERIPDAGEQFRPCSGLCLSLLAAFSISSDTVHLCDCAGGKHGGAAGAAEGRPGETGARVPDAAGRQDQTGDGDRRVQEADGRRGSRVRRYQRFSLTKAGPTSESNWVIDCAPTRHQESFELMETLPENIWQNISLR